MTVLGIVGCQVLEDEIAHVISNDPDVRRVIIFDQTEERTLARKLLREGQRDIIFYDRAFQDDLVRTADGLTVLVSLKPISLHQTPSLLREEVMGTIGMMGGLADSVLIFYGQCGNAFLNIELLAEGSEVPLTILMDGSGCPVDDCFGTALGGREEYREFLLHTPGPAFIMNPMWAANWRHFMQEVQMMRDPSDVDEVKAIFQYMDYRCIVGLDTGIVSRPSFEGQLSEMGQILGVDHRSVRCGSDVVQRSYTRAKTLMEKGGP